jgi:hypothetical protein
MTARRNDEDRLAATTEELGDDSLETVSGGGMNPGDHRPSHRPKPKTPSVPPVVPDPIPSPAPGGDFGICVFIPGFINPCNRRPV